MKRHLIYYWMTLEAAGLEELHLKGMKIMPTAKEREEKKALKLQVESSV